MVLEIPPADDENSITGSIDEAWQTAIEDVGPAGVDKGKGGKYLILPPGYNGQAPEGYIALPSGTYAGFALLRSNLKTASDADIAKAVGYGKRVRFYPLLQAANPPETKFVDAIDVSRLPPAVPWPGTRSARGTRRNEVAMCYNWMRQPDQAIAEAKRALELERHLMRQGF
jgi:hypothetical protein